MESDVVFNSPYLDKYSRLGWYLDISMLLLLGDAILTFGSDSVVDLDNCDYTFDNWWFEVIKFFDLPHIWCHTRAYFRFDRDLQIFMELHAYLHLWGTHQDDDLFVILSWSPKGASLEPFNQTHTLWHLDVIMLLLLRYTFFICRFDSVMDEDD